MKKFINPYIAKCQNWPEQLISNTDNSLNEQNLAEIADKANNYNNLILELGSGSGQFLINLAKNNPKTLHIGIELRFKRAVRTIEKASLAEVENLILIRGDLHKVVNTLPDQCFKHIYINFPDPWEKKRWHKNRLIQHENLQKLHRIAAQDALLSFKTDHDEYFDSSLRIFQDNPFFEVINFTNNFQTEENDDLNIKTEFEQLFESKSKNINFLMSKKIS